MYNRRKKELVTLEPEDVVLLHNIIAAGYKREMFQEGEQELIKNIFTKLKERIMPFVNESSKDLFTKTLSEAIEKININKKK